MAVIHHTTLVPTKLELVASWLPDQPWYERHGEAPNLAKAGGFRLDDPEGEVGIEFLVVSDSAGGTTTVYHVPLTYRGSPLEGAEAALIGTTEHGVLGTRWVYDGAADPVARAQLAALIRGEAEPQAQSVSHTSDPTVLVHLESGAEPATDVRVVRVLRAEDANRAGDADATEDETFARGAGHVIAGWTTPDGTESRGRFAVLDVAQG